MSASRLNEPDIIAIVDPDAGQDLVEYVERKIAEQGLEWPIVVVSGLGQLAELQSSRETELANLRDVIERVEIKAERPKAPDVFLERFRPAKDWEQRNRQRPRRKKRR